MSILHFGATKLIVLGVYGVTAMAVLATEPTVKVAIIVAVPGMITGIGTMVLGFLNRKDARAMMTNQDNMKTSIDGHFTKLLEERQKQGEQLVDKTDKLAHAEGRREGIESTEDKSK